MKCEKWSDQRDTSVDFFFPHALFMLISSLLNEKRVQK